MMNPAPLGSITLKRGLARNAAMYSSSDGFDALGA
jgi:hypothetical protein